jgi:hypothetical protein
MPSRADQRHLQQRNCDRISRLRNFTPPEAADAIAGAVGPDTPVELRYVTCLGTRSLRRTLTANQLRTDRKYAKWSARPLGGLLSPNHVYALATASDGRKIPLFVARPAPDNPHATPSAGRPGIELKGLTPEQIEALGKLTPEQIAAVAGTTSTTPAAPEVAPAVPPRPVPAPRTRTRGQLIGGIIGAAVAALIAVVVILMAVGVLNFGLSGGP